jgi:hypothetical protein
MDALTLGRRASLGSRWSAFLRLPWRQHLLGAEALLWLGLARMAVQLLPFRWIVGGLRRFGMAEGWEDEGAVLAARGVCAWMTRWSRHVPWRAMCLEQALAGFAALRVRGIRGRFSYGVAGGGSLRAHAWLSVGGRVLVGGDLSGEYVEMLRVPE